MSDNKEDLPGVSKEVWDLITEKFASNVGQAMSAELVHFIKRMKRVQRFQMFKSIFWMAIVGVIATIEVVQFADWMGISAISDSTKVAIVPLSGPVGAGSGISADNTIPVLKRVFESNVDVVILKIDSGGGSPNESDRINSFIDEQKAKSKKKVIAVCQGICASAAYMMAMHADEVYAGRYSWVGSIGAIMKTWNVSKLTDKFDVEQQVFASGHLKDMGDMFSKQSPEVREKMQQLVNSAAEVFKKEVQMCRGNKLAKSTDLYTGEVWGGEHAKELGLIDGIGNLEDVLREKYPDAKTQIIKPVASNSGGIFSEFLGAIGAKALGAYQSDAPVEFRYNY